MSASLEWNQVVEWIFCGQVLVNDGDEAEEPMRGERVEPGPWNRLVSSLMSHHRRDGRRRMLSTADVIGARNRSAVVVVFFWLFFCLIAGRSRDTRPASPWSDS